MKYFTLFPLQGYWGKWLGGAFVLAGAALAAIIHFAGTDLFSQLIHPATQLPVAIMLLALGLYMMAFSKEKIDDERVQRIRYTAQRGGLMAHCIGAFSFLFPSLLQGGDGTFSLELGPDDLTLLICLLLAGPLLIYQIIFQVGLLQDGHWAYNDLSAEDNLRKNPGLLIFLGVILIEIVVLLILGRS